MGTQPLLLCDAKTTPEGIAIQQLERVAALPGIDAAAGMPDLHAGRGYPIGAAFFSRDFIYPALIGSDIGCGMGLWQTDLLRRKTKLDKLIARLPPLETPLGPDWDEEITELLGAAHPPHRDALGTIGGGNHFAELQRVEAVLAPQHLPPHFDPERLLLLIHSGSRGLGGAILRRQVETYGHEALPADGTAARDYLQAHDEALRFAAANRLLIAQRLARAFHCKLLLLSDCSHNRLSSSRINGEPGWLHRKGAAPADAGLVVIAGSRGSHSYLGKPTGKDGGNLASLAHGAGRKWQRGACKSRLADKYRPEELRRNPFGGHVICADKTLLYDEAPQAYRNIEHTIGLLTTAGLIEPVLRLTPLLTYKTQSSGGGRD